MINGVTMKICVDDYILRTLKEDINDEDVSTNAVMPVNKQGSAQLICKDDGVICGLDVFFRTFRLLDDTARFDCTVQDGDRVQKGQLLGTLYGDIKAILSGERTALNYLQRMSGIAPSPENIWTSWRATILCCWTPARPHPICAPLRSTPLR